MAKLRALKTLRYGGRDVQKGEEFETETDKHTTLFVVTKQAERVQEASSSPSRKDEQAEDQKPAEGQEQFTASRRGRYRRRDVRPED